MMVSKGHIVTDISECIYQSMLDYEKNQPYQDMSFMMWVVKCNFRDAKKAEKRFNRERKQQGKAIRCTVVF